jgi:hypothetical protein
MKLQTFDVIFTNKAETKDLRAIQRPVSPLTKRRNEMGEKGSKKDKNKADKQKKEQLEKKQEQQKAKLPTKKPA